MHTNPFSTISGSVISKSFALSVNASLFLVLPPPSVYAPKYIYGWCLYGLSAVSAQFNEPNLHLALIPFLLYSMPTRDMPYKDIDLEIFPCF